MASESLEKVFTTAKRGSLPGSNVAASSNNMPSLKKDQIKKESFALKAIDKRRKTLHQGRVKD